MIELLRRLGFKPHSVTWELTLACNLNCRHCGSQAGRARSDELSPDEALDLCRDLIELGTRRVTLAGGEPTLRADWPKIGASLTAGGIAVNLLTNGRGWSRELVEDAKRAGLESVAFSVDGLADSHDYIRRIPGQWQQVLRGIDTTVDGGMPVGVVTQVNSRNFAEIEQIRDLLAKHRVSSWQIQLGNPSGNLADNRDLLIDPQDVLELLPRVAQLRKAGGFPRVFVGDNIGYYGEHEQTLRDQGGKVPFWTGCRAGCTVMGIESNGNIKGCLSLPSRDVDRFVEGNTRQRPLREIWEDPNSFAFNRQFSKARLQGFCRSCEYGEICRGGCNWTSFSHTGECGANPYCYHRIQIESGGA